MMEKFLVSSGLMPGSMDAISCALAIPKMLKEKGIKDVKITNCYCCGADGKIVFVTEAANKEAVLDAMTKIDLPTASVMETKEVKPK
jgi:hypothetical protein